VVYKRLLEALEGSLVLCHPVSLGLRSCEVSERLETIEILTMWSSKNAAMPKKHTISAGL